MARLKVKSGRSAGQELELTANGTWEVGSSRRASLRIRDRGISYTHASVYGEDGVYVLVDEHSTAGTYVNGERVEGERTLSAGDALRFGATEVEFTADGIDRRSASGRLEALRGATEELHQGGAPTKPAAEPAAEPAGEAQDQAELLQAREAQEAAEADAASLREQVDRLRDKLIEQDRLREEAEGQLAEARAEAADLRTQLDQLTEEMLALEDELERARGT